MRCFLLIVALLLIASPAWTTTLYVDGSDVGCSDSTPYASNDADNPWCTIGRAAWGSTSRTSPVSGEAAQAGDTVLVAAGTYSEPGAESMHIPAFNPTNSGSAGNPITFQAVGTVNLTLDTETTGSVFGASGVDHITWDGFTVDESTYTPYDGEHSIGIASGADYITFRNLRLIGDTLEAGNHSAIRSEGSDGVIIEYNVISDVMSSGDHGNTEGVLAYTSTNLTIRYNTIYDSSQGIFIKGDNPGPVYIHNNLIHDVAATGIYILGLGEDGNGYGGEVYQNVVYNAYSGLQLNAISGGPDQLKIVNNTFDNMTWMAYVAEISNDDNVIQNNIFYSATEYGWIFPWAYTNDGDFVFDRNLYYSIGGTFLRLNYSNYTFSDWQTTWTHDVNGSTSDPLFTDRANHDYTLQSGSPAATLGVDVLNLLGGGTSATIPAGAYIDEDTCVGAGCSPTVAAVINFNQAGSLQFNQTGTVNFNQ